MRFFRKPFGQKAGRKSGGAQAPGNTSGGMSGGLWDKPTGTDWDLVGAKMSLAANREQVTPERKLAESRTHANRIHPLDQERLDRTAAAKKKADDVASLRSGKPYRSPLTGNTPVESGYNPNTGVWDRQGVSGA